MRYVKVDKIPELKKGGRNRLQGFIKEFMSDNSVKVAKLNWKENEYKNVNTARNSVFHKGFQRFVIASLLVKRSTQLTTVYPEDFPVRWASMVPG